MNTAPSIAAGVMSAVCSRGYAKRSRGNVSSRPAHCPFGFVGFNRATCGGVWRDGHL